MNLLQTFFELMNLLQTSYKPSFTVYELFTNILRTYYEFSWAFAKLYTNLFQTLYKLLMNLLLLFLWAS